MMGLISEGINSVKAFVICGGLDGESNSFDEPLSVIIRWCSVHEKPHQVYINGRLGAVTVDDSQRFIEVGIVQAVKHAICIEVFAVEHADAYKDHSEELSNTINQSGRLEIGWVRNLSLPFFFNRFRRVRISYVLFNLSL